MVTEMHESVTYWMKAGYRKRESEFVTDASPAAELAGRMRKLITRWRLNFRDLANDLADRFPSRMNTYTANSIQQLFKAKGYTVRMRGSKELVNVLSSLRYQQVSLIKSIAEQHLNRVDGIIQRGIIQGRDLGFITDELYKHYGITRKRAAFIATDQVRKATESLSTARAKALGVKQGRWIKRGGTNNPRESHEAMDQKIYDLDKGMYDPAVGRYVWPGSEPGCTCTFEIVIPELEAIYREENQIRI